MLKIFQTLKESLSVSGWTKAEVDGPAQDSEQDCHLQLGHLQGDKGQSGLLPSGLSNSKYIYNQSDCKQSPNAFVTCLFVFQF